MYTYIRSKPVIHLCLIIIYINMHTVTETTIRQHNKHNMQLPFCAFQCTFLLWSMDHFWLAFSLL